MTLAELRALCERAIDDPTRDDYEHALVAAARIWLPALIEGMEALRHIAYEPFGHAEASHAEVLGAITKYARAALARLDEGTK